jgi:hypothetical protein
LLLFALHPGTLPDDQFFALKNKTSSGSPIAICADLLDEPAITILPIMLQTEMAPIEE